MGQVKAEVRRKDKPRIKRIKGRIRVRPVTPAKLKGLGRAWHFPGSHG